MHLTAYITIYNGEHTYQNLLPLAQFSSYILWKQCGCDDKTTDWNKHEKTYDLEILLFPLYHVNDVYYNIVF